MKPTHDCIPVPPRQRLCPPGRNRLLTTGLKLLGLAAALATPAHAGWTALQNGDFEADYTTSDAAMLSSITGWFDSGAANLPASFQNPSSQTRFTVSEDQSHSGAAGFESWNTSVNDQGRAHANNDTQFAQFIDSGAVGYIYQQIGTVDAASYKVVVDFDGIQRGWNHQAIWNTATVELWTTSSSATGADGTNVSGLAGATLRASQVFDAAAMGFAAPNADFFAQWRHATTSALAVGSASTGDKIWLCIKFYSNGGTIKYNGSFEASATIDNVTVTPIAAPPSVFMPAGMLVYEPFDYTAGTNLNVANGGGGFESGSTWSTATTNGGFVQIQPAGVTSGVYQADGTTPCPFKAVYQYLPSKGNYAGMNDGGAGTTSLGSGRADHIYMWRKLDPSVTASFTNGSTTWLSFSSARGFSTQCRAPSFSIGAGRHATTNNDRGDSMTTGDTSSKEAIVIGGSSDGTAVPGTLNVTGPANWGMAAIFKAQYYNTAGTRTYPAGLTGAVGAGSMSDPSYGADLPGNHGYWMAGGTGSYTGGGAAVWNYSTYNSGSVQIGDAKSRINVTVAKIQWGAGSGGSDLVSYYVYHDNDPITKAAFDAGCATWDTGVVSNKSTFNYLSIGGGRYFVDELRVATNFAAATGSNSPNGDFELGDLTAWNVLSSTPAPAITTSSVHSGTYAARLGNELHTGEPEGDSAISQMFTTVPANARLKFYVYRQSLEAGIQYDWQDAYIINSSGTVLETLFHVQQTDSGWVQYDKDMSAYAGQTVGIKFLVHGDGYGVDWETNMRVDDVELYVLTPASIKTFTAAGVAGYVDQNAKTVAVTVPYPTDFATLAPTYTVTTGTGSPVSGTVPSPAFSPGVATTYTITDGAIVNNYAVTINRAAAMTGKQLLTFVVGGANAAINESAKTVVLTVPGSVTALAPTYTLSTGATCDHTNGGTYDFTSPVVYRVTAEDGNYVDYTVTIASAPANIGAIHVDIGNLTMSGLVGPAGGSGMTWNAVNNDTATANYLLNETGTPTAVSITTNCNGVDQWSSSGLEVLKKAARVFDAGALNTMSITGLTAGRKYDIYIATYASDSEKSIANFTTTSVTSNGATQSVNNTLSAGRSTWAQGTNYVLFEDVEPIGSSVAISAQSTNNKRPGWNGLQIIDVTPVSDPYVAWASGYPGTDLSDPNGDADGDGLKNVQEYGFATIPNAGTGAVTYATGVVNPGRPDVSIGAMENGVDFRAVFSRPLDWQAKGLTYTVQFSADNFTTWWTTAVPTTQVATDGTNEAVSVPYPLFIPVDGGGYKKPTFFRVGVSKP